MLDEERLLGGVALQRGRPDLGRLYARLEDEYEVVERAEALDRKLAVVGETATALTDLIDTQRALGLELAVAILIGVEIVIAAVAVVLVGMIRLRSSLLQFRGARARVVGSNLRIALNFEVVSSYDRHGGWVAYWHRTYFLVPLWKVASLAAVLLAVLALVVFFRDWIPRRLTLRTCSTAVSPPV